MQNLLGSELTLRNVNGVVLLTHQIFKTEATQLDMV